MTDMGRHGKFIVFEGLDGSGKTTQLSLLERYLVSRGRRVTLTAEPTDGETGRLLREALAGKINKSQTELAALFVLDRIEHNTKSHSGIRALLAAGYDVICDRYYYSSIAYQGSATDPVWVTGMNLDCPDILRPDLCIFLDLEPELCMERIRGGRRSLDIFEKRELLESFRKRYFDSFDMLRRGWGERIAVIDASGSIDEVAQNVARAADAII